MKMVRGVALTIFAASALAACSGLLPGMEPLPTLFVIPTLTPAPGAAGQGGDGEQPDSGQVPPAGDGEVPPAGDGELPPVSNGEASGSIDLTGANQYGEPTGVSSYRTSLTFTSVRTLPDGTQATGSINGEGSRRVDPPATFLVYTAEGTADFGGGTSMSFAQIEGTDYLLAPTGECLAFASGTEQNPYGILLSGGGMLGDLNGAQLAVPPMEMVNGVQTYHYTFNESNLNTTDPTTSDVTTAQGDVYVAVNGGYLVRLVMSGTGASSLLNGEAAESEISYELNYFDFNQPVEIAPPEGCAPPAEVTSNFPALPDAVGVQSAEGLYTYTTGANFEDAVAFYQAEMPAAGYTLTQELVVAPNASLTYSDAAGATVQINVAPDAASGGTLVAIIATP